MRASTFPRRSSFGACALTFLIMLMSVLPAVSRAQAVTPLKAPKAPAVATPTDLVGPPGSVRFGQTVTALPNGNIVVTDPLYNIVGPSSVVFAGAVYLYNGATGALISQLTGSHNSDRVGEGGVTVLSNGNYVIRSLYWDSGTGAVTWGSATTGVSGVVSAANSLVGGSMNDSVGGHFITVLNNGNYVVSTPNWQNGALSRAGAVTWGNGATGTSGVISAANSLVGGNAFDEVGVNGATVLTNGNYVFNSPFWNNNVGAVTWGNGASGTVGVGSAANGLAGSTPH